MLRRVFISGRISGVINPRSLRHYTTLCHDGAYSRSKSARACAWHGGVKEFGVSPPGASTGRNMEAHPAAVYLVDIKEIGLDRKLFQNREEEYSEESVQRIIQAVQEGVFKFEVFDPILLWKRPDGRLIVLSGHSRTEAFTRLAKMGYQEFRRIPAKIIEVSQAEAKKIALESNTLSTRETDVERAAYYRTLRESEGVPAAEVEEMAKKNEGNNGRRIIAYSFLNPAGRAIAAIKSLEGKDATSQENVKSVANWVGTARQKFPALSNIHEDEMYKFLISGGYGRQYTNMRDFLQKIQAVIFQRTEFGRFSPETPLNLANLSSPTSGEQEYNAQRADLMKRIRDIDSSYKDWIKRLNEEAAAQPDRDRILAPLEMQLRTARQKLVEFDQKATRPAAAARQELNLFALSGYRRHNKLRAI